VREEEAADGTTIPWAVWVDNDVWAAVGAAHASDRPTRKCFGTIVDALTMLMMDADCCWNYR